MLDEKALRRPDFTEGVRLKLADGQEWEIPRPVYQIFPRFADDGSVTVHSKVTFGGEIDYFLDLDEAPEGTAIVDDIARRMSVMAKLLRRNYSLTNDDLGVLLSMNRRDPESAAMWLVIDRVLVGEMPDGPEAPKPSADGSATP